MTRRGLLLTLLLLLTSSVFAKDEVIQRSFLEDPTSELGFEALPQAAFEPFTGVLSRGYSQSTFWIRLRIAPAKGKDPLFLRIRPNYLDEVRLFDPASEALGEQTTGDEQAHEDSYRSLNLNLMIQGGEGPRDVWLRVKTQSTLLFSAEALALDDILRRDQAQQFKSAFYLSLVGLFIVWGGLNWWATRDRILLVFTVKQAFCLLYMSGLLGYIRLIGPEIVGLSSGLIVDLSMGFYGAAAFWFEYCFLSQFRPKPCLLNLLKWLPAFLPAYLALVISGRPQEAFMLCMSLFMLAPILTLALALTSRPLQEPAEGAAPQIGRPLLVSAYALILVGLSLTSFPIMGLTDASDLIFDSPLIYSLINGLLMLILLQLQIRNNVSGSRSRCFREVGIPD